MSRFGSDPLAFFNSVYENIPPWDIGMPQPAMADMLAKYPPLNPVLDVGCGSGDLSIYLAQHGHQVLGIDFVEAAISNATEKLVSLPADVADLLTFQVADALKPSLLQQQFGAVVDSGFFHLFDAEQCNSFIHELEQILLPNGCYYLHAFSIEFAIPNVPRKIDADELQALFTAAKGWQIKDIQAVEFLS